MCLLLFHHPLITKTNETVICVAHAALLTRNYRQKETTIKTSIIMNIIIATLIAIIILLLFISYSAVFYSNWPKEKAKFAEAIFDKVSSLIDSKMESVTGQREAGPWYLVVYTKDSDYPIWISNNTIRSIHPDPKNYKLVIKQFNGEDMVIENVESYELSSASDLCNYDM